MNTKNNILALILTTGICMAGGAYIADRWMNTLEKTVERSFTYGEIAGKFETFYIWEKRSHEATRSDLTQCSNENEELKELNSRHYNQIMSKAESIEFLVDMNYQLQQSLREAGIYYEEVLLSADMEDLEVIIQIP